MYMHIQEGQRSKEETHAMVTCRYYEGQIEECISTTNSKTTN